MANSFSNKEARFFSYSRSLSHTTDVVRDESGFSVFEVVISVVKIFFPPPPVDDEDENDDFCPTTSIIRMRTSFKQFSNSNHLNIILAESFKLKSLNKKKSLKLNAWSFK